jgi:TolB-like protein
MLCVLLAGSAPGLAQEPSTTTVDSTSVVVLPFANYTGRYEAIDSVLPMFYEKVGLGGLRVMTHEELRPILRRHRARVVGELSARAADLLRGETGARIAVVGSIDVFEPERSLEVLISARVVHLETKKVLLAVSLGRTVQETERAFGVGRAAEIEEIVDPVVNELIDTIRATLHGDPPEPRKHHSCGVVAVIPLDDYSTRRHGAKVLENLLIAELADRSWSVVEPGMIRELLLEHRLVARGGAPHEVSRMLREELDVCYVLTGEVDRFDLTVSGLPASVPHIEYGIRLVDGRSQRLVASVDQVRDGLDGETLLGLGREYSMARLARTSIRDVLAELEGER